MTPMRLAGAALLLSAIAAGATDAAAFFTAWLAAWSWCLGLVLGAFVNVWIHALSGGAWGRSLRAPTFALGLRMPWLLALSVPLLLGARTLYPWALDPSGWSTGLQQPTFARAWFSVPFVAGRCVVYAAVWCRLTRPDTAASSARAAVALLMHGVVGSLAAVDLWMSLTAGWFSSGFGLVALASQAVGATAFVVLLLTRDSTQRAAPWPDHGNLLLMWVGVWAYVAFMQLLIIWSEDLPPEIAWYLPRLQTPWRYAGLALALTQFAIPTLALLSRAVKRDPQRLAVVAACVWLANLLDAAWTIAPSVAPHNSLLPWLLPWIASGMVLLLFGDLLRPPHTRPMALRTKAIHGPR